MLTKGRVGFIKNTIKRTSKLNIKETNKDNARFILIDFITKQFGNKKHQIQMLTLPSAWWNFERILRNEIQDKKSELNFYTTGCENNNEVFKISCAKMPRTYTGLKYKYSIRHDTDVLESNLAKLYRKDIFEYLKVTSNVFNFIWLDLMSPLNTFDTKLHYLDHTTKVGSIVSITFVKARDSYEYIGQRQVIVTRILNKMNFQLIHAMSYTDTSPMMQLTFIKEE